MKTDDALAWQQRRAQRRAWLRLTYAERLAWLADAKRFVADAEAARLRRHQRDGK